VLASPRTKQKSMHKISVFSRSIKLKHKIYNENNESFECLYTNETDITRMIIMQIKFVFFLMFEHEHAKSHLNTENRRRLIYVCWLTIFRSFYMHIHFTSATINRWSEGRDLDTRCSIVVSVSLSSRACHARQWIGIAFAMIS
jgi:hypothetical protein